MPDALTVMVRASDDCHASSAVTSLTEPSLKDAIAFNWVVLPMATAGCEGVIVTDSNAAATAPFAAGKLIVSFLVPFEGVTATPVGLAAPTGRFIAPLVE